MQTSWKICSTVLKSSEALLLAELDLRRKQSPAEDFVILHIPVVVTTAQLVTCRFTPADVDLATGSVPKGTIEPIPFLRFRKSLSLPPAGRGPRRILRSEDTYRDLGHMTRSTERTTYVVSAPAFTEFLGSISFPESEHDPFNRFRQPWQR